MTKPIPERAGVPVFGNFFVYQRDRLRFLKELREEFGDVAAFRMGSRRIVVAVHPDDVAWVLQKNAKNYLKATNLSEVLGNGVLTSEGDFWRRQRKLIQPIFHHAHIASLAALMNEKTRETLDRFDGPAAAGETVNISSAMTELACEVVGHALFGSDLKPHFSRLSEVMKFVDREVTRRLYRLLPIPNSVPTPGNLRFKSTLRKLDSIIYALVDNEKRRAPSSRDLISLLMQAKDEETGESMDRLQLRDEAATLLLAGHETTGQTLAWTLALLADHPAVLDRLVAEIDGNLRGGEPDLPALGNLPYLGQVLDESMRVYPSVWAFGRKAVATDEIRGFAISPGDVVLLTPYFTHRHEEFWPDPERFDPERFAPARAEGMHKFAHFPFGGGPRQCIGKHFALMEAKIVLAQFLQRFRPVRADSRPIRPLPQVTMSVAGGLRLRLEARKTR